MNTKKLATPLLLIIGMFLLAFIVEGAITPTCTYISPSAGQVFYDNQTIVVHVTVNTNTTNLTSYITLNGVTTNPTAIQSAALGATPSNFSVTFTNVPEGSYSITGKAYVSNSTQNNVTGFSATCASRAITIDMSDGSTIPAQIIAEQQAAPETQKNNTLIIVIIVIIGIAIIYFVTSSKK